MSKFLGRTTRGFTLLEVLVAVMILGLSYVAVLQSFSMSMKKIVHLEAKRDDVFASLLDFEEKGRFTGEFTDDEMDNEETGSLFLEGSKYNLVILTDEGDDLMTLALERSL